MVICPQASAGLCGRIRRVDPRAAVPLVGRQSLGSTEQFQSIRPHRTSSEGPCRPRQWAAFRGSCRRARRADWLRFLGLLGLADHAASFTGCPKRPVGVDNADGIGGPAAKFCQDWDNRLSWSACGTRIFHLNIITRPRLTFDHVAARLSGYKA